MSTRGGYALGICNGFQILTETGLLPGALMRNAGLKFVCKAVDLHVATSDSDFTRGWNAGDVARIPVAHHDGNYTIDADGLARLKAEDRIAFTYVAIRRTAPWPTLRASCRPTAGCWGSCRTPNAPSRPRMAARTGRSFSAR